MRGGTRTTSSRRRCSNRAACHAGRMSGWGDRWPIVGRRAQLARFDGRAPVRHRAGRPDPRAGRRRQDPARRRVPRPGRGARRSDRAHRRERHRRRAPARRRGPAARRGSRARPGRPVTPRRCSSIRCGSSTRPCWRIAQRSDGRRLVTVVDDIHLLDDASLTLLSHLLARSAIFLIGTVRTGEPVPDLLTGLWRDDRVARIDLDSLSREHVDTLLHLVLGAPMEVGAALHLWSVSRGNPLYLRELVLGALDAGALVDRSGVWHLDGPVAEQRASRRPRRAAARRARPRCPFGDGAPVVVRAARARRPRGRRPAAVVEGLERSGLVEAVARTRPHPGSPRAPAARRGPAVGAPGAAPVRAARRAGRRGSRRVDCAAPMISCAAPRWRLESGDEADPELLERAAHIARYAHDFRLVERLVRAVPSERRTVDARLLLGEVLLRARLVRRGRSRALGGTGARDDRAAAAPAGDDADEEPAVRPVRLRHARCASITRLSVASRRPSCARSSTPTMPGSACSPAGPARRSRCSTGCKAVTARTRSSAIVLAPALRSSGGRSKARGVAETGFAEHLKSRRPARHRAPGHAHRQPRLRARRLRASGRSRTARGPGGGDRGDPIASRSRRSGSRSTLVASTGCRAGSFPVGTASWRVRASPRCTASPVRSGWRSVARRTSRRCSVIFPPRRRRARPPRRPAGVRVRRARAAARRRVGRARRGSAGRRDPDPRRRDPRRGRDGPRHRGVVVAARPASDRGPRREHAPRRSCPLRVSRRCSRRGLGTRPRSRPAIPICSPPPATTSRRWARCSSPRKRSRPRSTSSGRRGDQRSATANANRARTLAEACEGAQTPGLVQTDAVVPLSRANARSHCWRDRGSRARTSRRSCSCRSAPSTTTCSARTRSSA